MEQATNVGLKQVRQALADLYDPERLGNGELAGLLPECRDLPQGAQRAEVLRELLLGAIEAVRPAGRSAPTASAYRAHECLHLRYVAGLSVEEIAEELSLGWRQVYRDLLLGERRLVDVMEGRRHLEEAVPPPGEDHLLQEVAAIVPTTRPVDLVELTTTAVATVIGIASRRGVALSFDHPQAAVLVRAIPGVLHQILVQLTSAAVQSLPPGAATVRLERTERHAVLSFPVGPGEPQRGGLLEAALRLASAQKAQDLTWSVETQGGAAVLSLRLPLLGQRRVLIVEDNPAAVALYERYLADSEWEPFVAPHPRAAASLAVAHDVDVVVLDIMMPEADGWTVLQALKLDRGARDIPVVICSVVADSELGLYLGASEYLAKPVTRQQLLETLARAVARRNRAATAPETSG